MKHAKKEMYAPYTRKQCRSIEIILEEAQTLDLLDKDFKSVTINRSKN